MLQIPGNSIALREISQQDITRLEKVLAQRVKNIGEVLAEPYDTIYVSFLGAGLAQAAAELVYWPLRQLSERNIRLVSGEEILYHTLPYHDERSLVILFGEPGTENLVAKTATTVRLTGNNLVPFTAPLPATLSQYLPEHRVEISEEPIPIAFIVAAAKLVTILVDKYSGIKIRRDRVRDEYSNIAQIYDDLLEKYSQTLSNIVSRLRRENPTIAIYSSPTLMPASHIFEWCLSLERYIPRVYSLSAILSHMLMNNSNQQNNSIALFLLTDVETDILREAKFKLTFLRRQSIEAIELIMHTDPLTAPLYASLILIKACTELRKTRK